MRVIFLSFANFWFVANAILITFYKLKNSLMMLKEPALSWAWSSRSRIRNIDMFC